MENDIGIYQIVNIKTNKRYIGSSITLLRRKTARMNEKSNLTIGQFVKQGDIIGKAGSTGNSSGVHVHLELRLMKSRYVYQIIDNGFGHKGQTDPYAILEFCKRV